MADVEQGLAQLGALKETVLKTEIVQVVESVGSEKEVTRFRRCANRLSRLSGLETRGIERVEEHERHPPGPNDYHRIFMLWLSSFLTGNNILVGLYGPSLYRLDWHDAVWCAVFGGILGSIGVAYMSTLGPRSGNRTLVATRSFIGYYPSKACCLLNVLTMLGYAMVNGILGGQIIFTLSNGLTAVPAGIVIVAVLTWCVATFGMPLFHLYTRYAWAVQAAVLCIMIGCAGPHFDTSRSQLIETSRNVVIANRLSFFSLCFSSAITWAPSSADYFVYFPPSTSTTRMVLAAASATSIGAVLTTVVGVGLATSITHPNEVATTAPGALLAGSLTPLGGVGRFCAVLLMLGTVSNNIPCTYSAGLNLQMLGRYGPRIPRPLLTTLEVVLYTVCAVLGRSYLREILENFLPLMAYWIVSWLAMCLEEAWIFRRGRVVDWTAWNSKANLPVGLAAGGSLLLGCLGGILGMSESYFVGPVTRALPAPCDLGVWLSVGFTVLVYPLLRWVELRVLGR